MEKFFLSCNEEASSKLTLAYLCRFEIVKDT